LPRTSGNKETKNKDSQETHYSARASDSTLMSDEENTKNPRDIPIKSKNEEACGDIRAEKIQIRGVDGAETMTRNGSKQSITWGIIKSNPSRANPK